ncbi:DUF262 domain-containing protein [Amphibiibacter pelophylacis]|uniref:DUF262 domain-containing protein n=1 Tax=Amphibiibacter pelophylacis TaxID=1799477 RepID=A0ACC6NY52_9BURK
MSSQNKLDQVTESDSFGLSIEDAVRWPEGNLCGNSSRLMLPPIQRSLVWNNAQIINYWDSLLRGYPGGTMLVHQLSPGKKGIDFEGKTHDVGENDYLLFDGQQRMSALLLGYGTGPLSGHLKLWVDLGKKPEKSSDLKFQLRVTSAGQPFGYQKNNPSQKIDLDTRRKKWNEWQSESAPSEAFKSVTGRDLLSGVIPIELSKLLGAQSVENIHQMIRSEYSEDALLDLSMDDANDFFKHLAKLKKTKTLFQIVSKNIINNSEDYSRLFARLGQGGTRLSDNELAYSIIKNEIPEVREGMQDVVKKSGRLASDVDLALAGLRVTKMEPYEIDWDGDWEKYSRPNPASTLAVLRDKKQVRDKYEEFICEQDGNFHYAEIVSQIRDELEYDTVKNPNGLPKILLAQLPKALIEVLVLFFGNREDSANQPLKANKSLLGFVLAWLGFVHNHDKAADAIFYKYSDSKPKLHFTADSLRDFFAHIAESGAAYQIPHAADIKKFSDDLIERKAESQLRSYNERFLLRPIESADSYDRKLDFERIGATLRVLSSDQNSIKRILLWLQRKYIQNNSPNYDPTSERDEDLPIDLDHVIPNSNFGYHWAGRGGYLADEFVNDAKLLDYFRSYRGLIGNSLGNFRWLDSSENRGRGDSGISIDQEALDLYCFDSIESIRSCDRLIFENRKETSESLPWTKSDVADFQFLIDARTLFLIKKFITESGIEELVHPATDSSPDPTASATT